MRLMNGPIKKFVVCSAAVAIGSMATACGDADTGGTIGPSSESAPGPESAATTTQQANRPPEVDFSITDSLPEQGDIVHFDATETTDPDGDELTYSWRFGDGLPGGSERISHIYTDGGDFEVTLTVADAKGATSTLTKTVSIKDRPFPTGEATVLVQVEDFDYQELDGVTVSPVGSDKTAETDDKGFATLENMPAGQPFVLRLEKDGYMRQTVRVELPKSTKEAPFAVQMQPIGQTVTIENIENGGEAVGEDGARVAFPADAIVDSEGNLVTGDIQVQFTNFDVGSDKTIGGFPGSYMGIRQDGSQIGIRSFGAIDVKLFQDGERLQVRPGKTAEMDIPAFQPGMALGDDIPLWSLDESTGIWVEEGRLTAVKNDAAPNGRVMRTEVTHFTTWNGDTAESSPCQMRPKCMVVDLDTGKPTIPLRPGESCQLEVTTGKVNGLGDSCSSDAPSVAGNSCTSNGDCKTCQAPGTVRDGQACSSDSNCGVCEAPGQNVDGDACTSKSDCSYTVDKPDKCFGHPSINGDSCNSDSDCDYKDAQGNTQTGNCRDLKETKYGTCKDYSCAAGGMTCSGGTLPGGQGPVRYCKTASQCTAGNLSDWMFCSGGSCSLRNTQLFQFAGGFNQNFTIPSKGGKKIVVPNVDVTLKGKARLSQNNNRYILQGATNAPGNNKPNKNFFPATKCGTYKPIVPLQHTCQDGVQGFQSRCTNELAKLFCEKVFQCGGTEYAQALAQSKGVSNVPQCIEMVKTELDEERVVGSIQSNRAEYDGSKAASCLDKIISMDCKNFAAKAWNVRQCSGILGKVSNGGTCAHDLDCKDEDAVCEEQGNSCGGTCVPKPSDERDCGGTTCKPGEFCNSNNSCEQRRGAGGSCTEGTNCAIGHYCKNGTCTKKKFHLGEGDDCSRAKVCRVGLSCTPGQASDIKPNIFLVLDKSGSMSSSNKMGQAKAALDMVADKLHGEANFGLLAFDSHSCPANAAVQLSMGSHSASAIKSSYDSVRPGGGTTLGHALEQVRRNKLYALPNDKHAAARPKAVVAISDGQTRDNGSCGSQNVARKLKQNGTVYTYTIGFTSSADKAQLDRIAQAGGTKNSYTANNTSELAKVLGQISEDIITYDYSSSAMTCTRFADAGDACLFTGSNLAGGGSGCEWDTHCVKQGDVRGICKPDKSHGEACDRDGQCLSGNCVNGSCFGPQRQCNP